MRTASFFVALGLAGALALPVWAESDHGDDPETGEVFVEEVPGQLPLGNRTRAWMDRQRDGALASPHSTGLTPPEDYRARRRHLDSFSHPIPDLYDFETLGSGGS